MRLLHIEGNENPGEGLSISLREFLGGNVPKYAILSHRWREEEVLYADMTVVDKSLARCRKGYAKLESFCREVFERKISYAWTDTCCIDKSSSAELSEAINSMYSYYANASICIAYLDDVDDDASAGMLFSHATWFSRGWTLQELIAPKTLCFYSRNWRRLGTKVSLSHKLSRLCGIAESVLQDPKAMADVCVSEKMSWAASRTTTRPEDASYSLMGLFGVNMPPLYGEGAEKAFRRLQLEILQTTVDHTLFAWHSDQASGEMLASEVSAFVLGHEYTSVNYDEDQFDASGSAIKWAAVKPDYSMTNAGLYISLPMSSIPWQDDDLCFAFLACRTKRNYGLVAVCLQKRAWARYPSFFRVAFNQRSTFHLEQPTTNLFRTPNISIQTCWISRRATDDQVAVIAWTEGMKGVQYEVVLKSASPYKQVSCSDRSNVFTRQRGSDADVDISIPPSQRTLNVLKAAKTYTESKLPVQHRISGLLEASRFQHELIIFTTDFSTVTVAFMEVEQSVWAYVVEGEPLDKKSNMPALQPVFPRLEEQSHYHELLRRFTFFSGVFWDEWGDTGQTLLEGPRAFRDIKFHRDFDVKVALDPDGEGTLWLRIFIVRKEHRPGHLSSHSWSASLPSSTRRSDATPVRDQKASGNKCNIM